MEARLNQKKYSLIPTTLTEVLRLWVFGVICILILQLSGIDHLLAGYLYEATDHWNTRYQWILRNLLHLGGRYLVISIALFALFLSVLGQSARQKILQTLRLHQTVPNQGIYFFCIFLSVLLCTLIISAIKTINPITCPYKLVEFGGSLHSYTLLSFFDTSVQVGKCFPSGHASGGFSLMSLYFAATLTGQKVSPKLLIPGLALGILFGITQQIRGAHFVSHDIASFLICWTICLSIPNLINSLKKLKLKGYENEVPTV